jgi:hypothetical protein
MAKRKLTDAERDRMNRELNAVYKPTPDQAQCAINKILVRYGQIDRCLGNPPCRTCPSR